MKETMSAWEGVSLHTWLRRHWWPTIPRRPPRTPTHFQGCRPRDPTAEMPCGGGAPGHHGDPGVSQWEEIRVSVLCSHDGRRPRAGQKAKVIVPLHTAPPFGEKGSPIWSYVQSFLCRVYERNRILGAGKQNNENS